MRAAELVRKIGVARAFAERSALALLAEWPALRPPFAPRTPVDGPTLELGAPSRDVFVVTSAIHTSKGAIEDAQRLAQTFETIASVRARAPGAKVVLVECSRLRDDERERLARAADALLDLSCVPEVARARDGAYKGESEALLLSYALAALRPNAYERLFKLSGRYVLTDRFSPSRHPTDRIAFLFRGAGGVSTRLFSWPKRLEPLLASQLRKCAWCCARGSSIEEIIWRGLPAGAIHPVTELGVRGRVAASGDGIEE